MWAATFAHAGRAVSPDEAWRFWNWDPVLLLNLFLLCWLYRRGLAEQARRAGAPSPAARRRAACFAGGIAVVFVALVAPVDAISDQLSAVHMFQHMLLMMAAAPLFALAAPGQMLLAGLPLPCRKMVGHWLWQTPSGQALIWLSWQPLVAWALHALVLWLWHIPLFYQAALENTIIHDLQHLTFFVSALLFWRVLLDPVSRHRLDRGAGVLYLFTTSLHTAALGVFMALAPQVWYPGYEGRTLAWGLTVLEDQQLAGFLMWMPGGMIYGAVAAVLFALWLEEPQPAPVQVKWE